MDNYQTRIGSIVNPLEGLRKGFTSAGNIYQNYLTQQDREKALQLDRQNQERRLALAEEQAGWKRAERDRAQSERDFLRGYDPEIGMKGGQGMTRDLLEPVSQAVGGDLERINTRYGLGEGKSLGDLSPEKSAEYSRDVSSIAEQAEVAMRKLANPSSSLVTREAVANKVFSDTLSKTGNATLAQAQAQAFASPYATRKEIQATEQDRAEQAQDIIDRRRDAMVDNYDMLQARAKQFDKKTSKEVTRRDLYQFVNKVIPDTPGLEIDAGDTYESINDMVGKKLDGVLVTNEEILDVMKNEFVRGRWGVDFTFETAEELGEKIREYRQAGGTRDDSTRGYSTWDMLEKQRKQINTLANKTIIPESIPSLQRQASAQAYSPSVPRAEASVGDITTVRDLLNGGRDSDSTDKASSTSEGSKNKQPAGNTSNGMTQAEFDRYDAELQKERLDLQNRGVGRQSSTTGSIKKDLAELSRKELLARAQYNNKSGSFVHMALALPGSESSILTTNMVSNMSDAELRNAVAAQELRILRVESRDLQNSRIGIIGERRRDDLWSDLKSNFGSFLNTDLLGEDDRVAAQKKEFDLRDADRVKRMVKATKDIDTAEEKITKLKKFLNR